MAKRFRKVFIVCEDNNIFGYVSQITTYKTRDQAEAACKIDHTKAVEESVKMWNKGKPLPKYKVHGFWLVHEDLVKE